MTSTSLDRHDAEARTDMYCHACSKSFVALLDFGISGNHKIECPHCGHVHYRHIKDGVITGDRWQSDSSAQQDVIPRSVWKHNVLAMTTTTASAFLRDRWLNRYADGYDND